MSDYNIVRMLNKPRHIVWLIIGFGYMFAVPAWMAGEELSFNLLVFVASLILLVKSADYLVGGSSSMAHYFGVPSIVVGITVVAFGTSLPELTVSAIANLAGSSDLSVANIVGSNISNICLVLGLAAIIVPIKETRKVFRFDIPFMMGVSLLLPVLAMTMFFDSPATIYSIGLIDGLILLGLFGFFIYKQVMIAIRSTEHTNKKHVVDKEHKKLFGYLLMTVAGLTFMIVSAGLLVDSAQSIAKLFGVSEAIIGLTMIAVGTSLPELATNIVAAMKKKLDIAIGNVIGSNVFNILLVLGVASVIRPLEGIGQLIVMLDMPIMIGVTMLFVILLRMGHTLDRKDGFILLAIYVIYIIMRIAPTAGL